MKRLFWAIAPTLLCTLLVFLSAQSNTSSEIRLLSAQQMIDTVGGSGCGQRCEPDNRGWKVTGSLDCNDGEECDSDSDCTSGAMFFEKSAYRCVAGTSNQICNAKHPAWIIKKVR